jgi:hypothetical protein
MPKPETLLSDRVDDDYYLSKEETDTFVDLIKNATYGYTSSIDASAGYPTKILTSQLDKRPNHHTDTLFCIQGYSRTLHLLFHRP